MIDDDFNIFHAYAKALSFQVAHDIKVRMMWLCRFYHCADGDHEAVDAAIVGHLFCSDEGGAYLVVEDVGVGLIGWVEGFLVECV